MKIEELRGVALLVVLVGGGYLAYRAWETAAGAASTVGGILYGAYDAVSGLLADAGAAIGSAAEVVTTATPNRIMWANVTKPAVPVGGYSVQQPHVTSLPGNYQAANMFWSAHPNDIFYDL